MILEGVDVTTTIASIHDQVYARCGHRASPRLIRALRTGCRWAIAIALRHDLERLESELLKAIAYDNLREERRS